MASKKDELVNSVIFECETSKKIRRALQIVKRDRLLRRLEEVNRKIAEKKRRERRVR